MRIAQLSDLHLVPPPGRLYGRVDTAAALATALARLLALRPLPDLLLFSGDLADQGSAEDYAYLARCLAPLPFPYRLMPGNHDSREALMAAFPAQDWARPRCHQRVETATGTLLLLDTVVPGEEGGQVDQESLAWLESAYALSPSGEDFRNLASGVYDRVRKDPRFAAVVRQIQSRIHDRVSAARRRS